MRKTAIAGLKMMRAPIGLSAVGLLALLYFPAPLPAAEDATPAFGAAGATTTADLEYSVAQKPLMTWGLNLSPEPKAYQKEPDTAGRKVCRASLRLAADSDDATALLWDYTKGKLYLDLNHNRDLTDDPAGALTCPVSSFSYYYQTFTNVALKVKSPRGDYPVCVDLNLYNPQGGHPTGTVACRSFWGGKISLHGKDFQVGLADSMIGRLATDTQGSLLLRPWDLRQRPWDIVNGGLDAFAFSPNLFFDGQAYRLDCAFLQQDGASRFRISFREKPVETGDLTLTGTCIDRLVLGGPRQNPVRIPNRKTAPETPSVFTVVLDRPGRSVKVPAGKYEQWQVSLKSGNVSAHRKVGYDTFPAAVEVVANATNPAVLAAGGPLTNTVFADPQGAQLNLRYELLGGTGATYQLPDDRSKPPKFVVYKHGKPIHSGQFEFG